MSLSVSANGVPGRSAGCFPSGDLGSRSNNRMVDPSPDVAQQDRSACKSSEAVSQRRRSTYMPLILSVVRRERRCDADVHTGHGKLFDPRSSARTGLATSNVIGAKSLGSVGRKTGGRCSFARFDSSESAETPECRALQPCSHPTYPASRHKMQAAATPTAGGECGWTLMEVQTRVAWKLG